MCRTERTTGGQVEFREGPVQVRLLTRPDRVVVCACERGAVSGRRTCFRGATTSSASSSSSDPAFLPRPTVSEPIRQTETHPCPWAQRPCPWRPSSASSTAALQSRRPSRLARPRAPTRAPPDAVSRARGVLDTHVVLGLILRLLARALGRRSLLLRRLLLGSLLLGRRLLVGLVVGLVASRLLARVDLVELRGLLQHGVLRVVRDRRVEWSGRTLPCLISTAGSSSVPFLVICAQSGSSRLVCWADLGRQTRQKVAGAPHYRACSRSSGSEPGQPRRRARRRTPSTTFSTSPLGWPDPQFQLTSWPFSRSCRPASASDVPASGEPIAWAAAGLARASERRKATHLRCLRHGAWADGRLRLARLSWRSR